MSQVIESRGHMLTGLIACCPHRAEKRTSEESMEVAAEKAYQRHELLGMRRMSIIFKGGR